MIVWSGQLLLTIFYRFDIPKDCRFYLFKVFPVKPWLPMLVIY